MLATITKMQIDNKPYSITLVPLYRSSSDTPITIIVPTKQSNFIRTKFACGDTIQYIKDENDNDLLREPVSVNNTRENNYDNMFVETMKDAVDIEGTKYTAIQVFGKNFGCPIIKMYNNAYNVCPGDEILVYKNKNGEYSIVRNFSIEERRRKFLNKNR